MGKEKELPGEEELGGAPAEETKEAAPAEAEEQKAPPETDKVRRFDKKKGKEAELEKLKEENAALNDRILRNMAEFDNYKKRTAREKEELSDFAKALCVKELLGVVDNFERALACETQDAEFKKGVEMTFTQLQDALKRLGVEEIEALNQEFNPEKHNAVNQVQDENFGENIVCQVLQKGYQLNGKVIRPSMVVVANP